LEISVLWRERPSVKLRHQGLPAFAPSELQLGEPAHEYIVLNATDQSLCESCRAEARNGAGGSPHWQTCSTLPRGQFARQIEARNRLGKAKPRNALNTNPAKSACVTPETFWCVR
jgi:hypothetical protein